MSIRPGFAGVQLVVRLLAFAPTAMAEDLGGRPLATSADRLAVEAALESPPNAGQPSCMHRCPGPKASEALTRGLGTGPLSFPSLGGAAAGFGLGIPFGDRSRPVGGILRLRPLRWDADLPIAVGSVALYFAPKLLHHTEPVLCAGRINDAPEPRWPDREWRGLMSHWPKARNTFDSLSWATLLATAGLPLGVAVKADAVRASDVVVPLEAALAAGAVVSSTKHVFHRPRPYAHYCEPPEVGALCKTDSGLSFFSGHAAIAFALAFATREIASMKGYRNAGTIRGTSLGLAIATGVFRTAADRHYLSDVAVGAAVGWAIAKGVARLHKPGTPDPVELAAARTLQAQPPVGLAVPLVLRRSDPAGGAGLWLQAGVSPGGMGVATTLRW